MRRHPDAARGDKADRRWAVPRAYILWRPIRRYRDDRGRDENRWRYDNRRDDDTNAVAALPPGVGIVRHRRDADGDQPGKNRTHTQTLPWEHGDLLLPVKTCRGDRSAM
jgi:hypothetical protein